jgi:FkbM family methyltransferase
MKHATDVPVTGAYGSKFCLPNLVETIGFEIFINGIYEKETHDFLMGRIPPGAVVLDLGANIGSIIIPICRRRPDVTVICVEASPWVFGYLEKNIRLNGLSNVETVNRAILDTDDQEIDFFAPAEKFGKGSLTPHYSKQSIRVATIKIDTLLEQRKIRQVGLIKIDIQGLEYYAFKGAGRLLSSPDAPDILFEFEDWAERDATGLHAGSAQELLKEYGYTIYSPDARGRLIKQGDVLRTGSHNLYATKKQV